MYRTLKIILLALSLAKLYSCRIRCLFPCFVFSSKVITFQLIMSQTIFSLRSKKGTCLNIPFIQVMLFISPDKREYPHNIFLISPRGASNEYSQYIFSWRNKKNISSFLTETTPYLELWLLTKSHDLQFIKTQNLIITMVAITCQCQNSRFQTQNYSYFFSLLHKNIILWVLIRISSLSDCIEYSQSLFLWRNQKIFT